MSRIKACKTCGVPSRVGKGHIWNPNGTMVQRNDREHRMIFFDSDSVTALFSNLEELIGVPIEKIVIESKARATEAYIRTMIRGAKGHLARMIGLERIIRKIVEQGRLLGYGDIRVREFDWKKAYMICEITDPYSLPMFCGDLKGALQAIRKLEGKIEYEETAPNSYRIKDSQEFGATGLEERLTPRALFSKPGDFNYHSCPTCKAPLEISRFKWDFAKGTIRQDKTGIRYAVFGSTGLQVVLDELERELGDTIPATIVEAQRMHAAGIMSPRWKTVSREEIRNWLAFQGLGNLVALDEKEGGGYSVRIENPAIPLLLVGTIAALFELISGRKADIDWDIAADGDLTVGVVPAS
ncbi:MAG: hypothetical protein ACYC99_08705 [Candidatus Geothermincolia bacterium]